MSFHKEIKDNQLYLYMNGKLIYKRWLETGQSKIFDVMAYDKYTLMSISDISFEIDNQLTISNCPTSDIICVECVDFLNDILYCSFVTAITEKGTIKIRFDWKEQNNDLSEEDFLYIPETTILFFKSRNQWGAIDISSKTLKRHEDATWVPWIERKGNYVLILDDLKAESTNLNADTIHSVPIDPPTESKDLGDTIEYNSPIFGFQVLRTK